MTVVTGFTSARMLEIENTTIVDGEVVDGDLILKQRDDTEINAGSVIGPTGPEGPPGGLLTGEIRSTIAIAEPDDWFFLNGQTVPAVESTYPTFWAIAPTGWKSGSGIILPDASRRHVIGAGIADDPGDVGGSDFIALATANLPSHTHSDGTLATAGAGTHDHVSGVTDANVWVISIGGIQAARLALPAEATGPYVTYSQPADDGSHTHTISGSTAAAGSGTPYEHRPSFLVVNMMVYMGPTV